MVVTGESGHSRGVGVMGRQGCNMTPEQKHISDVQYGSSLVTFCNKKWGFVSTKDILSVGTHFSCCFHCGEVAVTERLK